MLMIPPNYAQTRADSAVRQAERPQCLITDLRGNRARRVVKLGPFECGSGKTNHFGLFLIDFGFKMQEITQKLGKPCRYRLSMC